MTTLAGLVIRARRALLQAASARSILRQESSLRFAEPVRTSRPEHTGGTSFGLDRRRELLIELTNFINDDLSIVILGFAVGGTGFTRLLDNFNPSDHSLLRSSPVAWILA